MPTRTPQQSAQHPLRRLMDGIGFNTILGRFIFTAVLLIAATITVAWIAQSQVNKTSRTNANGQSERITVTHTIQEMTNLLWQIETHFQAYMLVPEDNARAAVLASLDDLDHTTKILQADPWFIRQGELLRESHHLEKEIRQLQQHIVTVMEMRADPRKLFPNMSIMINELNPLHSEFSGTATNAIIEMSDTVLNAEQQQVFNLFNRIRFLWAQKINAFRMITSARVGVFNISFADSMESNIYNLETADQQIESTLGQLKQADKQQLLSLDQSAAIDDLYRIRKEWNDAYKRVVTIIMDDTRWRMDTPILRDEINPLFIDLWKHLQQISATLEQRATEDITYTTSTADQVSQYLWLLTFVVVVVAIFGSIIFEFQIRRPILRVVRALKAEATGEQKVVLPDSTIVEARDLSTAFDQMRNQIHARQQQVQSREQRLRSILDNTAEGIITFDHRCNVETWNRAAELLFGWDESEVHGTHLMQYLSFETIEHAYCPITPVSNFDITQYIGHETEVIGIHKNGSSFPLSLKISRMQLDGAAKYTAVMANITERKAMMENLRNLAEHDGLTGLHNRTYFHATLDRAVAQITRGLAPAGALLYLDLDNFKYVNDIMGHAAGDKLLVEVAKILNLRARRSDLVARLGGDEFVILITEASNQNIQAIAESFRRHLADFNFMFDGRAATIGCSIGVALIDITSDSTSEVMSQADLACHLAKRGGRNRVHVFTASDAGNVRTMSLDMGWSRRIKLALEHDKFVLALQPVVSTRTKLTETFEVLVRMRDEDGSIIMPSGFLPTAERFGMSADIDAWVIRHAITHLAGVRQRGATLRYAINLSGQSFSVPAIAELIPQMIHDTGIDPAAITFEITETVAIADMTAAVALLTQLRTLGCRTALDDFGSGMSSFAYLRELPVDMVKIDGRFVRNVANNPVDLAMLKAMNDVAHALGKQTVAEFVEDETHFNLICNMGLDYGQGYYLGKPALIDTWSGKLSEPGRSSSNIAK